MGPSSSCSLMESSGCRTGRLCLTLSILLSSHYIFRCAAFLQVESLNDENPYICSPCSQSYVVSSRSYDYENQFLLNNGAVESTNHDDICEVLVNQIQMPRLLNLQRQLMGEGSHRHLVSTLEFDDCSDAMASILDSHHVEAVIIEKLPNGVFADSFELHRLVKRNVFSDATVFGDTNLDLPSALSNRSIVEIHIGLSHSTITKNCRIVTGLPLHARYPPLNASGYAAAEFEHPDILIRYRPKEKDPDLCLWAIKDLNAPGDNTKLRWAIPCGDEAHTEIVSIITFASALVCALSVVLASLLYPETGDKDD